MERARDVAGIREHLAEITGRSTVQTKSARKDLRAARAEEATEIATSTQARELASRLAAAGNTQAREALVLAGSLADEYVAEQRQLRRGVHLPGAHHKRAALTYDGSAMAPPDEHPRLFVDFRRVLAEQRAAGVAFEDAWNTALAGLPNGRYDARWRLAISSTADAWRRAYQGEPAGRADQAVRRLEERGDEWADRRPEQVMA